jgi:acyl-coenzyme A thioesterase PaaI-like protein
VRKQPNSHMCFICGVDNPVGLKLKIYETEPGVIETNYTVPEHYQSYPGVVHGGIIATILDEISGRAHMGDPSQPRFMYTAKLEVKYRKNVPIGVPLKIVGKAGKSRGRMAEGWAGIYGPDGSLLAECNSLLVDLPPESISGVDYEALGWRVYPD